MKLRFWGVRGSFAMAGREFLRYGGNTCSIELVTNAGLRLLVVAQTRLEELERARVVETRVARLVDHAHRAAADASDDLVVADGPSDERVGTGRRHVS